MTSSTTMTTIKTQITSTPPDRIWTPGGAGGDGVDYGLPRRSASQSITSAAVDGDYRSITRTPRSGVQTSITSLV
jgi:hypothetical protein